MKQFFILAITALLQLPVFAQETSTPISTHKQYVMELGLVFPVNTDAMKDYLNANGIAVSPLTSGFGSGFQIGAHKLLNEKATLGVLMGGNMFITSSDGVSQFYQTGAILTGRLYFGETWRNGVFAEVGAGPEFGATKIKDNDFTFQLNFASRFGVGYNYQFNKNVTLGISAIVAPSVTAANYLDGAKIVANMLW